MSVHRPASLHKIKYDWGLAADNTAESNICQKYSSRDTQNKYRRETCKNDFKELVESDGGLIGKLL